MDIDIEGGASMPNVNADGDNAESDNESEPGDEVTAYERMRQEKDEETVSGFLSKRITQTYRRGSKPPRNGARGMTTNERVMFVQSSSRIRAFTKMARKRKATGAECAGKCYSSCITPSGPHSPVSQGPEDEERGLLVHRGCFKP